MGISPYVLDRTLKLGHELDLIAVYTGGANIDRKRIARFGQSMPPNLYIYLDQIGKHTP